MLAEIKRRPDRIPTEAELREVVSRRSSSRAVARELGVSKTTVSHWMARYGIPRMSPSGGHMATEVDGITASYFCRILNRAKGTQRSEPIEVTVTREDLWEVFLGQRGECHYTGLRLRLPANTADIKNKLVNASVDRVDSDRGYVPDNVVFVHKWANIMKNAMCDRDFLLMCNLVARRHPADERDLDALAEEHARFAANTPTSREGTPCSTRT